MSKGLFSKIMAEKYLDDQANIIDVVNASFIDRAIGLQADPIEEIGHAGARKVTRGGYLEFLICFCASFLQSYIR